MKLAIVIGSFISVLFVMSVMSQFDPEVEPVSYHQLEESK